MDQCVQLIKKHIIFEFSFVSAITILGNPPEVYFYGTQYLLIAVGFVPITLALAYIFVPVFFKLQLTSAYEVISVSKLGG